MGRKICVLGAGVIGLSTAVNIQQHVTGSEVTLIADKFSPNTTGDGAAGFWQPYLMKHTPVERLRKWSRESFSYILDLAMSPKGGEIGAFLVPGYDLVKKPKLPGVEADIVLGHRLMTKEELAIFQGYRMGYAYTTVILECKYYLPALMKRIEDLGGRFIERKVNNLSEIADDYDVVVNCTGLGARHLVNDDQLIPVSGQGIRVYAPWLKHFANADDDDLYILPCSDSVMLGGTHKEGDWDLTVDENEKRRILEGCTKLLPSLKGAKEIKTWVGLRPVRNSVRLEAEVVNCGGKQLKVVHNYGHGGAGVTLHWGCAKEATELVQKIIDSSTPAKL